MNSFFNKHLGQILFGSITVSLCILVSVGWRFDIPILTQLLPISPTTTPESAFILGLLGCTFLFSEEKLGKLILIPASLALLLLVWTGIQYLADLPISIEKLFMYDEVSKIKAVYPGRPSPQTVIAGMLLGIALIGTYGKIGTPKWIFLFTYVGFFQPWIALLGYSSDLRNLYALENAPKTGMSPITAVCFMLITMGILSKWPNKGVVGLINSRMLGGTLARYLLPIAIFVPILISAFLNYAKYTSIITLEVGIDVVWISTSIIMTVMIIITGWLINVQDSRREDFITMLQDKEREIMAINTNLKDTELELKESEERFRTIIASAPDAMVIANSEGDILFSNKQTETVFGYAEKELVGEKVELLIPEEFRNQHTKHRNKFHDEAKVRQMGKGLELSGRRKDGTSFPVEVSLSPIVTSNNEQWVAAAIRDITERKVIEQQILELNRDLEKKVIERTEELLESHRTLETKVEERTKQLKESNEELESFSYSVSHDLRAPLRAIIGFGKKLKTNYEDKFDPEGKRVLDVIINNTKQMGMLIDDILAFSRLGRTPISKQPVDIRLLWQNVFDTLIEMEDPNRTINLSIDENIPPNFVDKAMILQVLTNLASNALKYSRGKTPVEISVGYLEDKNAYYIRDNGVGFDERHADKLFGVFQRLHRASEFEGTGVGLAISHRIVKKHHGNIWGESKPGDGAIFYFTLSHSSPE